MSDYQIKWSGATTTVTPRELLQASGLRYSIGTNAAYRFQGTAIAVSSGVATKEWSWSCLIKNESGTVSMVGSAIITELQADSGASTWALAITADNTNKAIAITVTGQAGTSISWSVYADVDVIGYVDTSIATSQLTAPQLIDLIRVHHTHVNNTILLRMLSTAQAKLIRESKYNPKVSRIALNNQTLVGTTSASPLTLTDADGVYSWSFYKDTTVDTIVLKPNSNVMFFNEISAHDSVGNVVDTYSISINDDKSILIYDEFGTALSDFDGEADYLTIWFIKQPAALTMSHSSIPEIATEFHEALVHYVVSELYMSRTDMPTIDKLQHAKHFMNLYKEQELKAKFAYNMQSTLGSITARQGDDFSS